MSGLGDTYFYHKTTRKALALFEYLFSNIFVQHDQGGGTVKTMKVPIAFGSPHRDHPAYVSDPSYKPKEGVRVRTILPRMGFTLESWTFDSARKLNTAELLHHTTTGVNKGQYQKVPFDLVISLGILTDTLDDLFQIVEQILPWFDPKLTVSTLMNSDLTINDDIHIFLNSSDPSITFEGSFEDAKVIEATLSFTIKTFMYRRTIDVKPILKVDIDLISEDWYGIEVDNHGHVTEIAP